MVKFFHEAPNMIFKQVQSVTDGDYCLVHLLEENEVYRKLFFDAVRDGREVILDNSIFELGNAYDQERFVYWIKELKPTWYVIPDVLEDATSTLKNVIEWRDSGLIRSLPGKSIGVVQAKSFSGAVEMFVRLSSMVDMVAISFDYSFYEEEHGFSIEDRWMRGRQRLIRELNKHACDTKVHLLGTALPQEGLFYRNFYPWIYSIDTSNPVVTGLKYKMYSTSGMNVKDRHKLADQIDDEVNDTQLGVILKNIEMFKGFWK